MRKIFFTIFILATCSSPLRAQIVTFVFHNGSAADTLGPVGIEFQGEAGIGTYMDLDSGVTLSAEAFQGATSAGVTLNGANTIGFGVNGPSPDPDASRFNNNSNSTLVESMVFSFDTPGTFTQIDLRYVTGGTTAEALLSFAGGNSYELHDSNDLANDIWNLNENFTAGQEITLTFSAGASSTESFGLESFTINAVPEPSTYALIFGGTSLLFVIWWKRRK